MYIYYEKDYEELFRNKLLYKISVKYLHILLYLFYKYHTEKKQGKKKYKNLFHLFI